MHRVTNCLISSQATALKYNVGGSYDQIMYFLYKIVIDTEFPGKENIRVLFVAGVFEISAFSSPSNLKFPNHKLA